MLLESGATFGLFEGFGNAGSVPIDKRIRQGIHSGIIFAANAVSTKLQALHILPAIGDISMYDKDFPPRAPN